MPIYVDGDACPVKEEVYRVARRYAMKVYVVANTSIRVPEEELIEAVLVRGGFDVADDWIVERIGPDDIVVTTDIPLADRCLQKGARAIGPKGHAFSEDSMGEALATARSWTCSVNRARSEEARPPSPSRIGPGSSRSSTRPSRRSDATSGSVASRIGISGAPAATGPGAGRRRPSGRSA